MEESYQKLGGKKFPSQVEVDAFSSQFGEIWNSKKITCFNHFLFLLVSKLLFLPCYCFLPPNACSSIDELASSKNLDRLWVIPPFSWKHISLLFWFYKFCAKWWKLNNPTNRSFLSGVYSSHVTNLPWLSSLVPPLSSTGSLLDRWP